jgi:serine phosphatase RsbU (regulator of sigma subunit)
MRKMDSAVEEMVCMEVRGGNVPANVGMALPGLSLHVISRPHNAAAGGGDVHFVSTCGTGRITRLLVADVAGHGADVGTTARVLHGLMYRYVNYIDPKKFVRSMNDEFERLTAGGVFATAIVGTYFAPQRQLSLINAGHPPPLLYRAETRTWSLLDDAEGVTETNFPLGVVAQTSYEQIDLKLLPGDAVVCYTDSLPESRDPLGELLGYERIVALANALPMTESMSAWLENYLGTIDAISPGNLLADDLTVLLIRATDGPERARFGRRAGGAIRLIGEVLHGRRPIPWPEWTVKNIGGAIFPWLGRQ